MVLVDTSVWINYINGKDSAQVVYLDTLLENPLAVGLTKLIYLEILQGAKNQKSFDQFKAYFSGQNFYTFDDDLKSHTAAAQIYFDCRKKGITIRSTIDCLISQCAIENNLVLLHNDKDFIQIARVAKDLRLKVFQ
jgi:predicted nucleic acid-binding protein